MGGGFDTFGQSGGRDEVSRDREDPGLEVEKALAGDLEMSEDVSERVEAAEGKVDRQLEGAPINVGSKGVILAVLGDLKEGYEVSLGKVVDGVVDQVETLDKKTRDTLGALKNKYIYPEELKPLIPILRNEAAVWKIVALKTYKAGSGDYKAINVRLVKLGIDEDAIEDLQAFLGVKVDGQFGPKTVNALSAGLEWNFEVKAGDETQLDDNLSLERNKIERFCDGAGISEEYVGILVDQKVPIYILEDLPRDRLMVLLEFEEEYDFGLFEKELQLLQEIGGRSANPTTPESKRDLSKIMDKVKSSNPINRALLQYAFRNSVVMRWENLSEILYSPDYVAAYHLLHRGLLNGDPRRAIKLGSEIVKGEGFLSSQVKSGMTDGVVAKYLNKRGLEGVSLFRGRHVLLVSSNERYFHDDNLVGERRFGAEDMKKEMRESVGESGWVEQVTTEDTDSDEDISIKRREVLQKFLDTPPPMMFFFDGHGDKGKIGIAHPSKKAGMISAADFAKVIHERANLYPAVMGAPKDIYVLDECFANEFIRKVRGELGKLGKVDGVKPGAIFITSTAPGQFSDEEEKQKEGAYASLLKNKGLDLAGLDKAGEHFIYEV